MSFINAITLKPGRNIFLIITLAIIIFTGGTFMLRVVPLAARDKIASGLLADFLITLPLFYYLVIIRPLKIPAKSLILVVSVCSVIAYLLLPQHQRQYILQVRKVTSVAEALFLIYVVTKFYKIRAVYNAHQAIFADPVFNLRSAMADVLGDSLPIKVIASELAVLRYGLLCWKKEKPTSKQTTSFTTHCESGYVALWCILLVAVMVEVVAFHLLLMKWSNAAAVILTILSIYGVIFLVADLSAVIKRRILITGDKLILRTGLRWRVSTSLANINSVQKLTADNHSATLYFKGGVTRSSCNMLITFKNPVRVEKLYGAGKEFNAILMSIDDVAGFIKLVGRSK